MKRTREYTEYLNEDVAAFFSLPPSLSRIISLFNTHSYFFSLFNHNSFFSSFSETIPDTKSPLQNHRYKITDTCVSQLIEKSLPTAGIELGSLHL